MKLYVATKLRTVTLRKSAKGSVEKKDVHLDEQITGIMHEVKKKARYTLGWEKCRVHFTNRIIVNSDYQDWNVEKNEEREICMRLKFLICNWKGNLRER